MPSDDHDKSDEQTEDDMPEDLLTRRETLTAGSVIAGGVASYLGMGSITGVASAASTEPRIQLGQEIEIDDQSGDLSIQNTDTSDQIFYDKSAGEWRIGTPLNLQDDWRFDTETAASTDRLTLRASGSDSDAEFLLHPTGSATQSRISVTSSSDLDNFSEISIKSNNGNVISSEANGTASADDLELSVDGTDILTLKTSGAINANSQDINNVSSITTDKASINDFSIELEKTTDQSISADTETTIDWDSQDADTNIFSYDTSTDEITVLEAGDYRLDWSLVFSSMSDQAAGYLRLYVNSTVIRTPFDFASGTSLGISGGILLKDLSANDIIRIDCRNESPCTLNGNSSQTYSMLTKEA